MTSTTTINPRNFEEPQEPQDFELEQIEEEDIEFNNLNNLIRQISKFASEINKYDLDIENHFDILIKEPVNENRKNTDHDKISILYTYLIKHFNVNLDYIKTDFDSIKKIEKFFKNTQDLQDKYNKTLVNLKNEINLDTRKYEYNISEYNKMVYEIKILKYFLIFVLCLFIIPILKLTNTVSNNVSIFLFFLILFLGIASATYLIYKNNYNRDDVFYKKINFEKPSTNEESVLLNQKCEEIKEKNKEEIKEENKEENN